MSKIKAIDPKIIVNRDVDRPQYSIEYYDTSDNQWHIGYGSYELKNVIEWLDTDFDVIKADVAPVRHGHIIWKRRRRGGFRHAKCLHQFCNFVIEDNAPCKHIAKIDERYATDEPYCSECGKLLGDFLNYCGNCGVRMDGDNNAELLETAAKPIDKNIAQSGLAPATENFELMEE